MAGVGIGAAPGFDRGAVDDEIARADDASPERLRDGEHEEGLAGRGAAREPHQGHRELLMDAAERWGRAHGAAITLLDTYDSPLSVPFYERHLGYSRRPVRLRKDLR